jgi:hypothetical protein
MAATNNISLVFTQAEIDKVNNAFKDINAVFAGKLFTLTQEQRDKNAAVAEGYEAWINDCYNGMLEFPKSVPDHVPLNEMEIDLAARKILNSWMSQSKGVFEQISDTNLVVGSDLRNNSLAYYGFVTAMQGNIPGLKTLYEKLSLFFKKSPRKTS